MSKIYVVTIDWLDEIRDESERENEHYFFECADDALEFGKNLSQNERFYNRYSRPTVAYLYSFESGEGGVIGERQYDVAWLDLDKRVRFR